MNGTEVVIVILQILASVSITRMIIQRACINCGVWKWRVSFVIIYFITSALLGFLYNFIKGFVAGLQKEKEEKEEKEKKEQSQEKEAKQAQKQQNGHEQQ